MIMKYLLKTKIKDLLQEYKSTDFEYTFILYNMAKNLDYNSVKKGEIVFRIGDPGDKFYIILSGTVSILKLFEKELYCTIEQYLEKLLDLKNKNEKFIAKRSILLNKEKAYVDYENIENIVEKIFLKKLYKYLKLNYSIDEIKLHFQENKRRPENYEINLNLLRKYDLEKKFSLNSASYLTYITEIISKLQSIFNNLNSKQDDNKNNNNNNINTLINLNKLISIENEESEGTFKLEYLEEKKRFSISHYEKFFTLSTGQFFGDFAIDTNTTRNATIMSMDDEAHLGVWSKEVYKEFILNEKLRIENKKINFIYETFFNKFLSRSNFEKKYYKNFIYQELTKGQVLFNEKQKLDFIYIIINGKLDLSFEKNYFMLEEEIDKILGLNLQIKKEFKEKQRKLEKEKNENKSSGFAAFFKENDAKVLDKQLCKKKNLLITKVSNKEILCLENFVFNFPIHCKATIMSDKFFCFKIDIKNFERILLLEKEGFSFFEDISLKKLVIYIIRVKEISKSFLEMTKFQEYYNKKLIYENQKENIKNNLIKNQNDKIINKKLSHNFQLKTNKFLDSILNINMDYETNLNKNRINNYGDNNLSYERDLVQEMNRTRENRNTSCDAYIENMEQNILGNYDNYDERRNTNNINENNSKKKKFRFKNKSKEVSNLDFETKTNTIKTLNFSEEKDYQKIKNIENDSNNEAFYKNKKLNLFLDKIENLHDNKESITSTNVNLEILNSSKKKNFNNENYDQKPFSYRSSKNKTVINYKYKIDSYNHKYLNKETISNDNLGAEAFEYPSIYRNNGTANHKTEFSYLNNKDFDNNLNKTSSDFNLIGGSFKNNLLQKNAEFKHNKIINKLNIHTSDVLENRNVSINAYIQNENNISDKKDFQTMDSYSKKHQNSTNINHANNGIIICPNLKESFNSYCNHEQTNEENNDEKDFNQKLKTNTNKDKIHLDLIIEKIKIKNNSNYIKSVEYNRSLTQNEDYPSIVTNINFNVYPNGEADFNSNNLNEIKETKKDSNSLNKMLFNRDSKTKITNNNSVNNNNWNSYEEYAKKYFFKSRKSDKIEKLKIVNSKSTTIKRSFMENINKFSDLINIPPLNCMQSPPKKNVLGNTNFINSKIKLKKNNKRKASKFSCDTEKILNEYYSQDVFKIQNYKSEAYDNQIYFDSSCGNNNSNNYLDENNNGYLYSNNFKTPSISMRNVTITENFITNNNEFNKLNVKRNSKNEINVFKINNNQNKKTTMRQKIFAEIPL